MGYEIAQSKSFWHMVHSFHYLLSVQFPSTLNISYEAQIQLQQRNVTHWYGRGESGKVST